MKRYSLILVLALIYLLHAGCTPASQDSIYILPSGFSGTVLILFNQSDGAVEEFDSLGNRIYRIPLDGFLKSRFSENYGQHKNSYYELDSNKQLNGIPYFNNEDWNNPSIDKLTKVIWNHETGTDNQSGKKRHYEVFSMSTIANSDSVANLRSNKVWSILGK